MARHGVTDGVGVPVWVPEALGVGVLVLLEEPVPVALEEPVPVWVPVPVWLDDAVPV